MTSGDLSGRVCSCITPSTCNNSWVTCNILGRKSPGHEKESALLGQCLELTRDVVKIGQHFSISVKLSNGFNFNFSNIKEKELPPTMKQKKKKRPLPGTTKRNQLRMKNFIDMKKASVMNTSSTVVVNDSQDVTLAKRMTLVQAHLSVTNVISAQKPVVG